MLVGFGGTLYICVDTVQIRTATVRSPSASSILFGAAAVVAALTLISCEDDPILAPQSGTKTTNGSYGNVAVAPPIDSAAARASETDLRIANPELY